MSKTLNKRGLFVDCFRRDLLFLQEKCTERIGVDIRQLFKLVEDNIEKAEFNLTVELWFSDDEFGPNTSDEQLTCVSQRVLKLNLLPSKGIHSHVPVIFDYFHLCCVYITVHGTLLALHQPYINIPNRQPKPKENSTLETVLFGNRPVTGFPKSVLPAKLKQACKIHRDICGIILSAYESLQHAYEDLNSKLPENTRINIEHIDCLAKVEKVSKVVKTFDDEEDLLQTANTDVAQLSAETMILWSQYLELTTLNNNAIYLLAKDHHQQRVKRFAEGFFVMENPKDSVLAAYEPSLHGHVDLSNIVKNSTYFQTLPPLGVECLELDGDCNSLAIIFEDIYTDQVSNTDLTDVNLTVEKDNAASKSRRSDSFSTQSSGDSTETKFGRSKPKLKFIKNRKLETLKRPSEVAQLDDSTTLVGYRKLNAEQQPICSIGTLNSGPTVPTDEDLHKRLMHAMSNNVKDLNTSLTGSMPDLSYSSASKGFKRTSLYDSDTGLFRRQGSTRRPRGSFRDRRDSEERAERDADYVNNMVLEEDEVPINGIEMEPSGNYSSSPDRTSPIQNEAEVEDQESTVIDPGAKTEDKESTVIDPGAKTEDKESTVIDPGAKTESNQSDIDKLAESLTKTLEYNENKLTKEIEDREKDSVASDSGISRTDSLTQSISSKTDTDSGKGSKSTSEEKDTSEDSAKITSVVTTSENSAKITSGINTSENSAKITSSGTTSENSAKTPSSVTVTQPQPLRRPILSEFSSDESEEGSCTVLELLKAEYTKNNKDDKSSNIFSRPQASGEGRDSSKNHEFSLVSSISSPELSLISQYDKRLVSIVGDRTINFITAKEELKRQIKYPGHLYSDFPSLPSIDPYFMPPPHEDDGLHLVVCVHGLDGNSADLRLVRTYIELALPGSRIDFLMSERNQPDTFTTFEVLTDRLVEEILYHIDIFSLNPSRISFIAHSLGNLIVRSAVGRPELSHLRPKLYTVLSLSGPHLGTLYNNSGLVNMGMWFMQKWKKSGSLLQLSFKDHANPRETFLYKLSQKPSFEFFKNVLLVASTQDRYVPYHSARIELCKAALKDSSMTGTLYVEMVNNIMRPLIKNPNVRTVRYDVFHALQSTANSIIGRAAHIAVLDSELFLEKFFTVSAIKYFK